MTELLQAWRDPARHFHSEHHLAECLLLWREWADLAEHTGEVGVALWFHDAVYEPRQRDNEIRSAGWAGRVLTDAGTDAGTVQRVHDLILATADDRTLRGGVSTPDEQLIVDIDLAVFGSDPDRYDAYERGLRKEAAWMPGFLYRRQRRELLQGLLSRDRIYRTDVAFETLESRARANILGALARLAQ